MADYAKHSGALAGTTEALVDATERALAHAFTLYRDLARFDGGAA